MSQNIRNINEFKPSVVGIDIGSIYTKIAAVDKGAVDIITNEANLRQTPTVVGYGPKERLIGQAGNVKLKSNYSNTIVSPNRYIGFTSSQYISQENKLALCQSKTEDNNQYFKVNCQGTQQKFAPEQVTAAFINKINQIVQINKLNNKNLTVSVPNYLSQAERQALFNSISIAKQSSQLSYRINLINESTAVGLDYGYYKRNQYSQKEQQAKNVMFIDLGYSKLSLYLIKFTKNYQKMIYQKHLRQFGCKSLDEIMLEFYTQMFQNNNPNLQTSIKQSKRATLKLLQNIEKQRRILSGNSQYDFTIECLLEDNDISYSMKKQEFENIISPAVNQIKIFLEQVKQYLKINGTSVSNIQLLGGGSRIPVVIRTISKVLQMEPSRTVNSSQSIARGAALYSAMNSGIFRMQDYHSVDLSPYQISCKWKGQNEEIENEANHVTIYNEGQHLYSKKTVQLILNADKNQEFQVYYPCIINGLNKKICTFKLNLTKSQETSQKKISLCIQLNSNHIIHNITATQLLDKEVPLKVSDLQFSQSITEELMKKYVKRQKYLLLKDYKIAEFYQNKNKFQSTFFSIKQKLKSSINTQNKQYINPDVYNDFLRFFDEVENTFEEIQNFESKMKQIKQKQDTYYKNIEDNKNKHKLIDEQMSKLIEFINNLIGGKLKNIRYYPIEQVNKIKHWIKLKQEEQQKQPKYLQPVITKEQIKQVFDEFIQKIQEYQEQFVQRQRQERQQNQYYNTPRHQQHQYPRQNAYSGNPFDNMYGRQPKKTRNNNGFFSGFPGFF